MVWHRVFQEPRKGFVAHTAASRKLVEDPLARAGLGYMFDEVWQSFAKVDPSSKRVSQAESSLRTDSRGYGDLPKR